MWHNLQMAEIVNLNRFRKAQDRVKKRVQADENAVKFGRTKAQRTLEEAQAAQARTTLEAHRRDPEDGGEGRPEPDA